MNNKKRLAPMSFGAFLVYTIISVMCMNDEIDTKLIRAYWTNETNRLASPSCAATMLTFIDRHNGPGASLESIDWPGALRCHLNVTSHQPLSQCMNDIVRMSRHEFHATRDRHSECIVRFIANEMIHDPEETWHCRQLARLIATSE